MSKHILQELSTPTQVKERHKVIQLTELLPLIELIENKMKDPTLVYDDRIEIIVPGEYSKTTRDEVVTLYEKRCWPKVSHITSSENGEWSGLTIFTFYF